MANDVSVTAELQGTIVAVFVEIGTSVAGGDVLALVESMKMHHELVAPVSGVVDSLAIGRGDTIAIGEEFARITAGVHDLPGTSRTRAVAASPVGLERDDLREVIDRHAVGLDANRQQAVERRRSR
ncbi:MAG TPA: acetyl-CoA carboxylase biotin carboxyl carrier protein subunit, partial [Ilumatobacteraceae bacterium]|nr:acetyl-CoA carboxylase biotin carboxyl carrier protein subunit [Ilumatobacteraceae bacterium]